MRTIVFQTLFAFSLLGFLTLACDKEEEATTCDTPTQLTTKTADLCPNTEIVRNNSNSSGYTLIGVRFKISPSFTLYVDGKGSTIAAGTYTESTGASISQSDLQKVESLTIEISAIDLAAETFSATFDFKGSVSNGNGGFTSITYTGSFTDFSLAN